MADGKQPQTARNPATRQQQIADGCSLTVVASCHASLHAGELDEIVAGRYYGKRRYDLMTTARIETLMRNPQALDLLVADIGTAIGLHGIEHLLIVAPPEVRNEVFMGVAIHPGIAAFEFASTYAASPLRPAVSGRTVVVACMDWRLHGERGNLAGQLRTSLGVADYDLLIVPGVGKDLAGATARRDSVLAQLRYLADGGATRVILVGHTDCGKYGGAKTFLDALHEHSVLAHDLQAAARQVALAVPALTVETAIARTGKDRIWSIKPLDKLP